MRIRFVKSVLMIIISLFLLRYGSLFAQTAAVPEAQQQPAVEAEALPKPDLPVDISIESIRLFNDLYVGLAAEIEVEIINNTDVQAHDVSVGFTSDDGSTDRQMIALGPSSRERIKLKWIPKGPGKRRIVISIVCKNDTSPLNNQQVEFVEVSSETYVDLKIVSAKIPPELYSGSLANIEAEIANDADVEIREANIIFNADDGSKDLKRVSILPKSSAIVMFSWVPRNPGAQNISLSVECKEDMNAGNNELRVPVEVRAVEKFQEPQIEVKEERPAVERPVGNKGIFKPAQKIKPTRE
ncbi:MAG: hypothetical protein NTZ92_04290 [Candidatus Omnitrophica bacterium]|nr:hypothetical protein [Candidatus Omnitrophota bacterium]